MNEQARACATYFQSRPGYRRISYGRPAGTIQLDDATQEECDAARNVFGRPFSPPLRFQAAQFEAALQELRFGKVPLKEVLESYFNTEIKTNSELREAGNSRFSTMIARILEQTDNGTCIRWLQALGELQSGGTVCTSLLLDRTSLSIKNGWQDEVGQVYIYYSAPQNLAAEIDRAGEINAALIFGFAPCCIPFFVNTRQNR